MRNVCWQAGFQPLERYAVLILDRQDRNSLKLLEDGPVLFNRFAWHRPLTRAKDRGPGGRVAPDWLVRVIYPHVMRNGCLVKAYRHREIVLEQLGESRLTPDEQERINGNRVALQDVFAPTPPEVIARLLSEAKGLEHGGGS